MGKLWVRITLGWLWSVITNLVNFELLGRFWAGWTLSWLDFGLNIPCIRLGWNNFWLGGLWDGMDYK